MNFEHLLSIIEQRINSNSKWHTLHQKKPFLVENFTGDAFNLILGTEKTRMITLLEFKKFWDISKKIDISKRFNPSSYSSHSNSPNHSYILAIIENTIWD